MTPRFRSRTCHPPVVEHGQPAWDGAQLAALASLIADMLARAAGEQAAVRNSGRAAVSSSSPTALPAGETAR